MNEKQQKICKYVENLSKRFDEVLWNHPAKQARLSRFKPEFEKEFWKRWDELDVRFKEYLDGQIEWDVPPLHLTTIPPSIPVFDFHEYRDVVGCGVDLLTYVVTETQAL